jgi:hypothetical protein
VPATIPSGSRYLEPPTLCDTPAQGGRVDEVDEGALAADLDDGQPLPVARLQVGIAVDLDLLEGAPELRLERRPRALAEVAAAAAVEDDVPRQRYG